MLSNQHPPPSPLVRPLKTDATLHRHLRSRHSAAQPLATVGPLRMRGASRPSHPPYVQRAVQLYVGQASSVAPRRGRDDEHQASRQKLSLDRRDGTINKELGSRRIGRWSFVGRIERSSASQSHQPPTNLPPHAAIVSKRAGERQHGCDIKQSRWMLLLMMMMMMTMTPRAQFISQLSIVWSVSRSSTSTGGSIMPTNSGPMSFVDCPITKQHPIIITIISPLPSVWYPASQANAPQSPRCWGHAMALVGRQVAVCQAGSKGIQPCPPAPGSRHASLGDALDPPTTLPAPLTTSLPCAKEERLFVLFLASTTAAGSQQPDWTPRALAKHKARWWWWWWWWWWWHGHHVYLSSLAMLLLLLLPRKRDNQASNDLNVVVVVVLGG
ncbi:hypothetical protein IWX92DRAFT_398137 [Phyllosticta citricarpa]